LGGIDIGGGLTITFSCCLIHSKEDDDDNASLTGLSIRIATTIGTTKKKETKAYVKSGKETL